MRSIPLKKVVAIFLAICAGGIPLVATALPPPGWTPNPLPYSSITYGNWNNISPAWSPNGALIAYSSDKGGTWQLYTMSPDGTSSKAITPTTYASSYPVWNSNSTAVAFWSSEGGRSDIRVVFVKNSTVITITNGTYAVLPGQPRWSPDGTQLLFFISHNGVMLASAELADRALKTVASVAGENLSADWVSSSVVVYSTLGKVGYEIDEVNVSDGAQVVIAAGGANYTAPVVSLATSKLAYVSDLTPPMGGPWWYPCAYRPGDDNLWLANLDGSNASYQSAPTGEWQPFAPTYPSPYTPATISANQSFAWSADGDMLAYTAYSSSYGACVYFWDVSIWASSMGLIGPTNVSTSGISWSPDNVTLAFSALTNGYYQIYLLNTTGQIRAMPVNLLE